MQGDHVSCQHLRQRDGTRARGADPRRLGMFGVHHHARTGSQTARAEGLRIGAPAQHADRCIAQLATLCHGHRRHAEYRTRPAPRTAYRRLEAAGAQDREQLGNGSRARPAPSRQAWPRAPTTAAHEFVRIKGAATPEDREPQGKFGDAVRIGAAGVDEHDTAREQRFGLMPRDGQAHDAHDPQCRQLREKLSRQGCGATPEDDTCDLG